VPAPLLGTEQRVATLGRVVPDRKTSPGGSGIDKLNKEINAAFAKSPGGQWRGVQMRKFAMLAAAVAGAALCGGAATAQLNERVQAGKLSCDISGGVGLIVGSQRTLNCAFTPSNPGPPEFYAGTLTKFGLDLGITAGGVMTWAVYAPTLRPEGALARAYAGASAEASVVAGVGANVLLGGSLRTIELQPLAVQSQTGLNIAAGVAGIELRWVRYGNP
jgi:hypothetical protein